MADWKGVRTGTAKHKRKLQLFDLKIDPAETTDVAADHPEVVNKMDQILQSDRTESKLYPLFGEAN